MKDEEQCFLKMKVQDRSKKGVNARDDGWN